MGNTPINWDELSKSADKAAEEAARKADEQLMGRIQHLTILKPEDVKQIFPDTSDKEKFEELMTIIKSAEEKNNKINRIVANSEKFAGIIVTLLSKLT